MFLGVDGRAVAGHHGLLPGSQRTQYRGFGLGGRVAAEAIG